ncbi:MAG TPA: LysR family transcriptional regulator [Stellaceae bacterium]|nr:LysR family transcriptional regulator [Stellaceae bacterium]
MANLAALDFTLLAAFEALLTERNVTRAAERVGMAQPSMSNALSRLRHLFDDELFVRTPKGMQPTTRALSLAQPVSEMLGQVRRLLDADAAFDPSTSERRFVLGVAPFASYTLLPAFIRMFRREAPHARVHFFSLELQDEARLLDESQIDLAVGIVIDLPKRFGTCVLFRDRPVCITRKDHPALRDGLTLERFVALPHVHATHYMQTVVDAALAQHGLKRRVVMNGHNYLAIGVMVAHSDLLAIVPERMACDAVRRGEIDVHELPLPIEDQPVGLAWSKHGQSDPAVMWLRDRIRDVMADRPGATAAAHQSSRDRRSASRR